MTTPVSTETLKGKAAWARRETLELVRRSPGIRIASSLSPVEIFVALFYGDILQYDPKNPLSEERDRLIISKGHGSLALYPILADRGFFDPKELERVSREDSFLADIPDTRVPGFETINGAMGHGLGVGCGMALALKRKKNPARVFIVSGDGELNVGAVWEAVMLSGHHHLDNLTFIIDNNMISMLDFSRNIIDLDPLDQKFRAFGWSAETIDGHDIGAVHGALQARIATPSNCPHVIVANTVKGKGVPKLENQAMGHIIGLREEEITAAIEALQK